jgi:hypothetical protein
MRLETASFVVGAALAVACGGKVPLSQSDSEQRTGSRNAPSPIDAGTGGSSMTGAATAADGSPATGKAILAPGADAASAASAPIAGSAAVRYACLSDEFGPSAPDTFVELDYERERCAGPGSDCTDFLTIRADCTLKLQVDNVGHDAMATPNDCSRLARWATSTLLAAALDDLPACSPAAGNPPESTEIELVSGPGPRKKTGICSDEPYVSHRACMASARATYFPGL